MKSGKLELFGFDDADAVVEDDDSASGSSNYRIKYFGFDELSDSDSEDEEGSSERRKAKRKAAAAVAVPLVSIETNVDSPPPREIQDSQSSHTAGHSHCLKHGQYLHSTQIFLPPNLTMSSRTDLDCFFAKLSTFCIQKIKPVFKDH